MTKKRKRRKPEQVVKLLQEGEAMLAAGKSHAEVRRHKHLFEQLVSLHNLLAAARGALRGKRCREPGASFYAGLESHVVDLHTELSTDVYRPGAYHYFRIHEPKERIVAAAPFRDRVVHHAVVRVIQPLFERRFIEDSFACRPGKGTHAAMRRAAQFSQRFRYALKCDVEKYFPSIDHGVLLSLVARVVGDGRLLKLIGHILASHHDRVRHHWPAGGDLFDVVLHPCGLPIGNLTSQFLANVLLNSLDHFVKHDLRVKGYLRYMDDFVLFGDDRRRLKEQGRQVKAKLADLHLRMHPDKYRLVPTRCGLASEREGKTKSGADGLGHSRHSASESTRRRKTPNKITIALRRHRCRPCHSARGIVHES